MHRKITCSKFGGALSSHSKGLDDLCHCERSEAMTCGFTLAEVLITLAIIGIVAAITIPTLLSKYQQYCLKVQFKKTYAMLQQVWLRSEYEFGVTPKCFNWAPNPYGASECKQFSDDGKRCEGGYILTSTGEPVPSDYSGMFSDCQVFGDKIFENLKVSKICQTAPYDNGCVPEYEGQDTYTISKNPDKSESEINASLVGMTNAMRKEFLRDRNMTIVLADGTIIINGVGTSAMISPSLFIVDINGKKGPNKWGYDVFPFSTVKSLSGNLRLSQALSFKEDGGKTVNEMLQEISSK